MGASPQWALQPGRAHGARGSRWRTAPRAGLACWQSEEGTPALGTLYVLESCFSALFAGEVIPPRVSLVFRLYLSCAFFGLQMEVYVVKFVTVSSVAI